MESADAHSVSQQVTGGLDPLRRVISPVGQATSRPLEDTMTELGDFMQAVKQLVKLLDELENTDGRAIWLVAEEVELDQWTGQVVAFRDALAAKLQ